MRSYKDIKVIKKDTKALNQKVEGNRKGREIAVFQGSGSGGMNSYRLVFCSFFLAVCLFLEVLIT